MSHALINCTCKNRLGFSLFLFTLIPQCLKRFACYRWPPRFPDISRPYGAWVKRGSGKHMVSLSLFDPRSRQSNISTSGEERSKYTLPRKNKISQMPFPWPLANKDNQIPTPPHLYFSNFCSCSTISKSPSVFEGLPRSDCQYEALLRWMNLNHLQKDGYNFGMLSTL